MRYQQFSENFKPFLIGYLRKGCTWISWSTKYIYWRSCCYSSQAQNWMTSEIERIHCVQKNETRKHFASTDVAKLLPLNKRNAYPPMQSMAVPPSNSNTILP